MPISLSEKVNSYCQGINALNYRLSFGRNISVKKHGGKTIVTFTHKGSEISKTGFDNSKLPWLICNPFKLIHLAAPGGVRDDLGRIYKIAQKETSDPTKLFEDLNHLILLKEEADVSYYAIYLFFEKLQLKAFDEDQLQKAAHLISWMTVDAFAEKDAPRIAFINGYLMQTKNKVYFNKVENLFPGMTTENLVGDFSHIIRFQGGSW